MTARRMVPPRRREEIASQSPRRLTGRSYSARDAQIRAEGLRWLVQCSHISAGLYDRALAAGEAVVRGNDRRP